MKLFDRWARLLEESPQERVHAPFVQELQAAGFLKVGLMGRGGVQREVGGEPPVQADWCCAFDRPCAATTAAGGVPAHRPSLTLA